MVYTSATTHKMVYTYTTNFPKGRAISIGVLNPLPQRHIYDGVNKRKLEAYIWYMTSQNYSKRLIRDHVY